MQPGSPIVSVSTAGSLFSLGGLVSSVCFVGVGGILVVRRGCETIETSGGRGTWG